MKYALPTELLHRGFVTLVETKLVGKDVSEVRQSEIANLWLLSYFNSFGSQL